MGNPLKEAANDRDIAAKLMLKVIMKLREPDDRARRIAEEAWLSVLKRVDAWWDPERESAEGFLWRLLTNEVEVVRHHSLHPTRRSRSGDSSEMGIGK